MIQSSSHCWFPVHIHSPRITFFEKVPPTSPSHSIPTPRQLGWFHDSCLLIWLWLCGPKAADEIWGGRVPWGNFGGSLLTCRMGKRTGNISVVFCPSSQCHFVRITVATAILWSQGTNVKPKATALDNVDLMKSGTPASWYMWYQRPGYPISVCARVNMWTSEDNFARVVFLIPLWEFQGSNLGYQASVASSLTPWAILPTSI